MKILLVSTFKTSGGAAVAVRRLYQALRNQGADVSVITFFDGADLEGYTSFSRRWYFKISFWFNFCLERLRVLFLVQDRRYLFKYSLGTLGINIQRIPQVREADIIHFHWVSQGFVDLETIVSISQQKPVLWTIHDFWPFTGGCHLPFHCRGFRDSCRSCFYLGGDSLVSHRNWRYKKELFRSGSIHFATVSHWQLRQLQSSSILGDANSTYLGNALDLTIYKPGLQSREGLLQSKGLDPRKFYVAFGAPDLADEFKGYAFLLEAIRKCQSAGLDLHVLIFGETKQSLLDDLPVEVTQFGSIPTQEGIVEVFQMADCFIQTSLQETLSYTVMEAMACGTPVVAFDSGGVADMIDHKKNGYLVELRDVDGLVEGIRYLLQSDMYATLQQNAVEKIAGLFDDRDIARKHLNLYNEMITTPGS